MKHMVFNIQRFCVNDGPGIRTTVFLKGCMLKCPWCHNPESKSPRPRLMLHSSKCVGCGDCLKVCPLSLHSFDSVRGHVIDRDSCTLCGRCVSACTGALEICGKEMTVDEIIAEVERDIPFYRNSGGGMTLSGGDPLYSPAFSLALLKKAKEKGLHTAIETCGFGEWDHIKAFVPYTDLFLWDVKETDEALHRQYTGAPLAPIWDNLRKLNHAGANIVLRCPIIPTFNDRREHLIAIAELAESLDRVGLIELEPFHPLGISKCADLGIDSPISDITFPSDEAVREWLDIVSRHTSKRVRKG